MAILSAGLGEDAISSAAEIAALCALMNRLVEGHGINARPDRLAATGTWPAGLAKPLAER